MNNLYRDENNKIKILNSGVKHVDMTKVQDKLLLGKLPYGKLPFDKRPYVKRRLVRATFKK